MIPMKKLLTTLSLTTALTMTVFSQVPDTNSWHLSYSVLQSNWFDTTPTITNFELLMFKPGEPGSYVMGSHTNPAPFTLVTMPGGLPFYDHVTYVVAEHCVGDVFILSTNFYFDAANYVTNTVPTNDVPVAPVPVGGIGVTLPGH